MVTSSLDLSALAKVSDGYSQGSLAQAVKLVLTERRRLQLPKKPLWAGELLHMLARADPVYPEEQELLQVSPLPSPPGLPCEEPPVAGARHCRPTLPSSTAGSSILTGSGSALPSTVPPWSPKQGPGLFVWGASNADSAPRVGAVKALRGGIRAVLDLRPQFNLPWLSETFVNVFCTTFLSTVAKGIPAVDKRVHPAAK